MKKTNLLLGALALSLAVTSAHAVAIVPDFDSFGSFPTATFGGSGIPNHAVATSSENSVLLGLTAHQRLTGPNLVNNGAGVFTAIPGPGTAPNLSTWNVGFYLQLTAANTARTSAKIFYDFDPAIGNDQSTLGYIIIPSFATTATQDSQNLGFSFFDTGIPGVVVPPSYPSFDPNAIGEYSFVIEAYNSAGQVLARTAINVNTGRTGSVPDAGSTIAMFAAGLTGLVAFKRRGTLAIA